MPAKQRPRLYVRINGLATGLTDDDLDAVVSGRPDGIMFPKAEGGAAVIHCDAKITAREAIHGLPDGALDIIAIATETAQAMFLAGTYVGASKRLKGLTWGAEDLSVELGAEANRDRDGHFLAPYQLARSLCLAGAAAAQVQAIDTVYIDFRNDAGLRRECEEARRDGFTGKMAIHPGQVAVDQRGVHADRGGGQARRGGDRGVRGQSRRRHRRHRRRDVRPPASGARPAIAGAGQEPARKRADRYFLS